MRRLKTELKDQSTQENPYHFSLYKIDEDPLDEENKQHLADPEAVSLNVDEVEQDSYNELLLTEPVIQREGQQIRTKIIGRKRDQNGDLKGTYNSNPILNTRVYLAEYPVCPRTQCKQCH